MPRNRSCQRSCFLAVLISDEREEKDWRTLTHASSRDQAVEELGEEGEVEVEVALELEAEVEEGDAVAELPEAVVVGPAHAPPPICVVVFVPGTTHNPSALLLFFLTTRFAFGCLSSGEGPRASMRTSPFRALRST